MVYVKKDNAYKPIINNNQIFVNEKELKIAKKYYFKKNGAKNASNFTCFQLIFSPKLVQNYFTITLSLVCNTITPIVFFNNLLKLILITKRINL